MLLIAVINIWQSFVFFLQVFIYIPRGGGWCVVSLLRPCCCLCSQIVIKLKIRILEEATHLFFISKYSKKPLINNASLFIGQH
jgi:hypothetical protein